MSLVAWYPLTNNITYNYGTHSANILSATFADNGVIGQCMYTTTVHNSGLERAGAWDLLTSNLSLSCWLKINKEAVAEIVNNAPVTDKATTPTGTIIGHNSYSGFALTWTSNKIYPSNTFTSFNVMVTARGKDASGGSPSYTTGSYSMPFDTWVHLTATFDRENNILGLYINGKAHSVVSRALNTIVAISADKRYFRINAGEVYGGNGPGRAIPMWISDVRLYDHALSPMEVKEIAKGLIFHYDFEDCQSNNICNWRNKSAWKMTGWSGNVAYSDDTLTMTATNGWRAFLYDIGSENIDKTITFSFDYKVTNKDNAGWLFVQHYNSLYYGTEVLRLDINNNEWVHASVTIPNCQQYVGFNLRGVDNTGKSIIMNARNIKIELGDSETLYGEYGLTQNTIFDKSGYGYDGEVVALTYTSATPSGTLSAAFNDNTSGIKINYIKGDLMLSDYTIAFWIKPTTDVRDTIFGNHQVSGVTQTTNIERYASGVLRIYYNGDVTSNTTTNTVQMKKNEWTHVAITYNKATKTIATYQNGIAKATFKKDLTDFPVAVNHYWIGRDARTGTTNLGGSISDFRFYGTTLSNEDILNLYNNPCSFDNKQNILTSEFIEGESNIDLKQNFTMTAGEFVEDAMIGLFNNKKVTGNQFIEI